MQKNSRKAFVFSSEERNCSWFKEASVAESKGLTPLHSATMPRGLFVTLLPFVALLLVLPGSIAGRNKEPIFSPLFVCKRFYWICGYVESLFFIIRYVWWFGLSFRVFVCLSSPIRRNFDRSWSCEGLTSHFVVVFLDPSSCYLGFSLSVYLRS